MQLTSDINHGIICQNTYGVATKLTHDMVDNLLMSSSLELQVVLCQLYAPIDIIIDIYFNDINSSVYF